MYTVSVRDHFMIAHSFQGEAFGPAQRLHGATYVVDLEFRRPELDTNVPLQPIAPADPQAGDKLDGAALLVGVLSLRPLARQPLVVDVTALYRRLLRLHDFDFGLASATVRWDGRAFSASISGEGMLLGGAPYALGIGGQLGARLRLSDGVTPWARYTLRHRAYQPDAYGGYSGLTHAGVLGVTLRAGRQLRADLGYTLGEERAESSDLAAWFHGPTAELEWRRGPLGVNLGGSLGARAYDAGRRDLLLAASTSVSVDLSQLVGLLGGVSLLRNWSSDSGFEYVKVTAFAGAYLVLAP